MVDALDFNGLLVPYQTELARLGVALGVRQRLVSYLELLWQQNQRLNLFSRRLEPSALVADHLLDSLIALPHVPPASVIADLGSGGGFPAIPLALCLPERGFLLYEKSPLKSRFLEGLRELCPNIEPRGTLFKNGVDPACELLIARGFKPLGGILGLTEAYFRGGGAYLLYKGRQATLLDEIQLAKISNRDRKILPLTPLGNAEERHLLLLRKNGFAGPERLDPT